MPAPKLCFSNFNPPILIIGFFIFKSVAFGEIINSRALSYLGIGPEADSWNAHAHQSYDLYLITNYKKGLDEDLIEIVKNPEQIKYWRDAFYALGILASVNPSFVNYEKLTQAIQRIESSTQIDDRKKVENLGFGYLAVGRFGEKRARNFLMDRLDPDYWANGIPQFAFETIIGDSTLNEVPSIETLQSKALNGLVILGKKDDYTLLNKLKDDPDFIRIPHMKDKIKGFLLLHSARNEAHIKLKKMYSDLNSNIKNTQSSSGETMDQSPETNIESEKKRMAELEAIESNSLTENRTPSSLKEPETRTKEYNGLLLYILSAVAIIIVLFVLVRKK